MRVIAFADGFTSASAPDVSSAGQEQYTLANNISVLTSITGLNISAYTTAFVDFELTRVDFTGTYRQSGSLILTFIAGAWVLNLGNYQGEDMVRTGAEVIALAKEIFLSVTAGGQVQYKSGPMVDASHVGTLKLQITRIF